MRALALVCLLTLASCRSGVRMEHCRSLARELPDGAVVEYRTCASWWEDAPRGEPGTPPDPAPELGDQEPGELPSPGPSGSVG